MKKMLIATLVAAFIGGTALVADDALAGQGKGGYGKGSGICKQTTSTQKTGVKLRLRDGSCLKSTDAAKSNQAKRGNTYGPGDGTGNNQTGPKDGTGYGTKNIK
ncbi:MAG TPA: hypothetical protein VIS94_01450 [Desulfomonilia bacterium]